MKGRRCAGACHAGAYAPAFVVWCSPFSFLREAIDSILAQHEPVRQIIVVDDGSADDTAARVTKYGPPVEYVHKPNGGKSSAVNLGLTRAQGE